MTKNEWTTEEVLQDITKQLENKEKQIDLLRTRIRSKIRRIEKLCTSNKKLYEENTRLKENIHSMLFTDDVVQDRYDEAKKENEKLKTENKRYSEQLNEAVKQYDNLKELLHQCKYELISRYTDVGEEDFSLITKIDNATGDSDDKK